MAEEKRPADEKRSAIRKPSGVKKRPAGERPPAEKKPEEKGSGGMITKMVASVFGAVVAPILVAVGVRHFTSTDTHPPTNPALVEPGKGDTGKGREPQKTPPQPVLAFNGKDLTGFYPYTSAGRGSDPKGVFTVVNGELRISGEESGYLATEKGYGNYNLIAEYRWGEKTWPPHEEAARHADIIVHANGPDSLDTGLVKSFTIRIQEGRTGDISLPKGASKDIMKGFAKVVDVRKPKAPRPLFQYMPTTGNLIEFHPPATVLQLNHDLGWKDNKGFRSKGEVEKQTGEWNTLGINCPLPQPAPPRPSGIRVILNGTIVNDLWDVAPFSGKVLIRSNGAEIFFRKLELIPRPPPAKK